MPDKRCDNGHFIDEQWDICPYCPALPQEAEAVVAGATRRKGPGERRGAPRSDSAAHASRQASEIPVSRTVVAPLLQAPQDNIRCVVGWLVAVNGVQRGESFPVRMGRNVIGRSSRADIVVSDDQASSHHADIVYRPDERRFILMDHNSTNGTFVNGAEIQARKDLANRDVVRVGKQKFIFQAFCDPTFGWEDQDYGK